MAARDTTTASHEAGQAAARDAVSGAAGAADAEALKEQPTGELVKRMAEDTSRLVRAELQLAKVEMTEKGRELGKAGGLLGTAAVTGLLALGTLTAFLVMLLDGVLANWLAALIVGVVWGTVAAITGLKGRNKAREAGAPVPDETINDVKEDVAWLQHRTRS
jgi:uncharacterized membrane protein YqjE